MLCCMVCHCSGIDDHPGLLRSPLTDPAPEPKPAPAPAPRRPPRNSKTAATAALRDSILTSSA